MAYIYKPIHERKRLGTGILGEKKVKKRKKRMKRLVKKARKRLPPLPPVPGKKGIKLHHRIKNIHHRIKQKLKEMKLKKIKGKKPKKAKKPKEIKKKPKAKEIKLKRHLKKGKKHILRLYKKIGRVGKKHSKAFLAKGKEIGQAVARGFRRVIKKKPKKLKPSSIPPKPELANEGKPAKIELEKIGGAEKEDSGEEKAEHSKVFFWNKRNG